MVVHSENHCALALPGCPEPTGDSCYLQRVLQDVLWNWKDGSVVKSLVRGPLPHELIDALILYLLAAVRFR